MSRLPCLHVITDDHVLARPDIMDTGVKLLAAGGPDLAFHVRGHQTPAGTLHRIASMLVREAGEAHIVVNDRVDIALATGAHGVQLGRRSAPVAAARALIDATFAVDASRIRIGYSAHDVAECGDAVRDGADFILAGTIHTSVTHPGAVPVGIALLERMTAAVVVPVIAIGGMTAERFADAATAGAAGAALLGAVWHAADPLGAFVACIREAHVFKTPET